MPCFDTLGLYYNLQDGFKKKNIYIYIYFSIFFRCDLLFVCFVFVLF